MNFSLYLGICGDEGKMVLRSHCVIIDAENTGMSIIQPEYDMIGAVGSWPVDFMVDSGACAAVLRPNAFENTKLIKGGMTGVKYKACGGEAVHNLGQRQVISADSNGHVLEHDFQVTEKHQEFICRFQNL